MKSLIFSALLSLTLVIMSVSGERKSFQCDAGWNALHPVCGDGASDWDHHYGWWKVVDDGKYESIS